MTIPAGARRMDLAGHTVIPGMVAMHEHRFYLSGEGIPTYNEQPFSFLRLYLGERRDHGADVGQQGTLSSLKLQSPPQSPLSSGTRTPEKVPQRL